MNFRRLVILMALSLPVWGSVFVPRSALASLLTRAESSEKSCYEVVWMPSNEQCAYITQNCKGEGTAFAGVNFLSLYYCNPILRVIGIVLLVLSLILAFVLIGIAASEFLCVNLYTISKFLQLNDNIAGLTLLALGNGSPDVIGTYKAMEMGSGGLAVSELIGAAFFITTVVIGSMVIVHPFKLPRRLFLRDLSFFVCISLFILISVVNGYLSISNSVALIGFYVFYVLFVMINHSISQSATLKTLREDRVRSNFVLNSINHELEPEDEDTINSALLDNFSSLPSIEEMNLLNINEYDEEYQRELISEYDQFRRHTDNYYNIDSTRSIGLRQLINELTKYSNIISNRISLSDNTDDFFSHSRPIQMLDQEDNETLTPHIEPKEHSVYLQYLYKVYPALEHFNELSITQMAVLPITFVLKVTTPVVDHHILEAREEDEGSILDKLFQQIQLVLSMTFLNTYFFSSLKSFFLLHLPLTAIAVAVLIKVNNIRLYAFLGFIQSIVWISIFATMIISLLKSFSIMFLLSDEIIGLTVFAVGNCVGDFISNFTIARMGMPIMAFGACFGSPLLTLSSMGLSALAILSKNENHSKLFINDFGYLIQSDKTLILLNVSLIANLFLILILAMRNNWALNRKSGIILICNWCITTTACCLVELNKS